VRWATIVSLVAVVVILLLYINPLYRLVGPLATAIVYDGLLLAIVGAGAVLAGLLWRSFDRGEVHRTIWASLGLGLLLWGVAEGVSAVYEVILGKTLPVVSVADIAWLIGFLPLLVALFTRYNSLGARPGPLELAAVIGAFVLLIVLAAVFVIGPILAYPDYERLIERLLDAAYPLCDLVVAHAALLNVLVLRGGALARPWGVIAAGFLVVSLADLLYAYATWYELYTGLDPQVNLITALVDVPYFVSYVLITLGLYMQARLWQVA
jgi:hypothetical protein